MLRRGRNFALIASFAAAAGSAALAHLEPGSMTSPRTGETYPAGTQVNITWGQAEYHRGNYILAFSRNGGATWENIASWTGPGGDGITVNYAWTVPDAPGAAARVRVCQIGACDEPEYVLVSGSFAIAPAAALAPAAPSAEAGIRLGADRNLEVSFGLAAPGRVTLKAYAADGAVAAVLLDGAHAAGSHAYSLSPARLRSGEALLLRLEAGGNTLATLRSAP